MQTAWSWPSGTAQTAWSPWNDAVTGGVVDGRFAEGTPGGKAQCSVDVVDSNFVEGAAEVEARPGVVVDWGNSCNSGGNVCTDGAIS